MAATDVLGFGLTGAALAAIGADRIVEGVETKVNAFVHALAADVAASTATEIPKILAVFTGAHFTYTSVRIDGNEILFEYVAPVEPTPRPSKNYEGVMGRSITQFGPTTFRILPPLLGDTWARENLVKKIKNIVVVMMENRSFDHVLGYRAQLPEGASSDGLSPALLDALEAELRKAFPGFDTHEIPKLRDAGFKIKTQLPVGVGHHATDAVEQLRKTMVFSGRGINSPQGFISNFIKVSLRKLADKNLAKPIHVTGYYEAGDLPFFDFLVKHYAWCERYFCSHPGPTLPNRMYQLAGGLQLTRSGEAIIENNHGADFFLSRAPNVHDLLTRKGVVWRVYESFPSVTMLRMFARYAGDSTNIVPLFPNFERDAAEGRLAPLTVIEPAMHHFPPNDDHPPADMCKGQEFLWDVYTKLSNGPQWKNTLLIVSYDEHGGFYDHVIPPVADLRTREIDTAEDDPTGGEGGPGPSSLLTRYGLRVPTFVVSPWVPPGPGPNIVLDHCSILKTILACFCGDSKPFLSDRVHASRSFDAFLTESNPRLGLPAPERPTCVPPEDPNPLPGIITQPVFRKQMRTNRVDYHDLTGMLARLLGRR
jgi:phospholipase C